MTHKLTFDEKKVDAIFAGLDQCTLPGAAAGIAVNGTPVYRKAFGLASMELPVLLSPTMRMRLGSTTKHFTALAFMLLCEDGKATPDDTIGRHLPELHPVTHGVTMRQLMTNTNGLRDVFTIKLEFAGTETRPVPGAEMLALYRTIDDVTAPPGTNWIYNNGGWLILSEIIERLSGQDLGMFMRERIFAPVGMADTLFRRWDSDIVPNSASPHMMRQDGVRVRADYGMENFSGAGAIASTVDDMLLWLGHMSRPHVGTAATWSAMQTPAVLANGTNTGYAFGLFIDRYRGLDIIHHAGGGCGCNAQMLKIPGLGVDIAIMVNRDDVTAPALAYRIIDACVDGLTTQPADVTLTTGVFASPTTGRVIELKGSTAAIDGLDLPMTVDAHGTWWPGGTSRYLKRAITITGDALRFDDYGNIDHLQRLPPPTATQPPQGHFRSTVAAAEITGATLRTSNAFGAAEYAMEALADNLWRIRTTGVRFYSAVIRFTDRGFEFSEAGMWRLRFDRVA